MKSVQFGLLIREGEGEKTATVKCYGAVYIERGIQTSIVPSWHYSARVWWNRKVAKHFKFLMFAECAKLSKLRCRNVEGYTVWEIFGSFDRSFRLLSRMPVGVGDTIECDVVFSRRGHWFCTLLGVMEGCAAEEPR